MPIKPKNPPTTPPIIGAIGEELAVLLLLECWTSVGTGVETWVEVVVRVCTTTDPSDCVEVDCVVITVGDVVETWEVGGVVIGVDMVAHEEPNNVLTALLVTSTVRVKGTCTVAVTAKKNGVREEHHLRHESTYLV
jgi:hypothetical protein